MILIIDNYDSFTYNLVQYLGEITDRKEEILIKRNDEISLPEIEELAPTHIIISPGPCSPNEAGISMALAKKFSGRIPILGVCLGHQAVAQAFGATIRRAKVPTHGKTSRIRHSGAKIFSGLDEFFTATRYHSLVVDTTSLPQDLCPIAWSDEDELMAFSHRLHPTTIGLQFHPESIMTPDGKNILRNFLAL